MNKIAKKLLATPLYEGHGEESDLPEDAAEEIARLESLVEELKADRIRINDEAETEIKGLQSALATAREEGRREGLEEAAKAVEALLPYECSTGDRSRFSRSDLEKYRKGALRLAVGDIRALKEKQP